MRFLPGELPGLVIVEPRVFEDDRGFFMEIWQQAKFAAAGIDIEFVQDNHSRSRAQVLRGLHYQLQHPQGKLVWAVRGSILDVAVDIRRSSATFGKWSAVELSETNRQQLYLPPGFAHGFCVLSEQAEVIYKCTALYDASDERTILWNDPDIGIAWPTSHPVLSAKDQQGIPLSRAETFA